MTRVGIGVIGCGNIAPTYLNAMRDFPILDIRGLADLDPARAQARADEFGLPAREVDALLADPEVEIIVNLTIPAAHVAVARRALAAGKHTYSEKPLAVAFAEGAALADEAARAGLRIGAAPDTFLGGGHQTARAAIDAGRIGTPIGGTAFFMCPGHERWHPDPDFYYKPGGGPVLDMAPYYLTDLVNLLGPVARVSGFVSTPRAERTIASGYRQGQRIAVETPTHAAAVVVFAGGALVHLAMSFDVAAHRHAPLEIYGTAGTLIVPDPNHFGGVVEVSDGAGAFATEPETLAYVAGNHRSLGVADMAYALRSGRPHRASGALALHVLEVMEAIGRSAQDGAVIEIATRVDRPAPLAENVADGRLAS